MEVSDFFPGSVLTTLILGITSLLLLYWYSTRNHNYWKERGVPFAKALPFIGSLYEAFSKPMHELEIERYRKYGAIYGHFEMNTPVISVADPDLLKRIMIKDFQYFTTRRTMNVGDPIFDSMITSLTGENWRRVRNIITPTFTTGKIRRMLSIFKECANTCVNNFKELSKEGKPVDPKKVFSAFSMDVIASAAFSTKIDSHNDPNNQFLLVAREIISKDVNWRFVIFFLFPSLCKLFGISFFPPKGMKFFKDATIEIIKERKRTGQTRNDFLQLMLDTLKEGDFADKTEEEEKVDITENYGNVDTNQQIFKNVSKKKLSENELVAQSILFFLGGYETTASTLSFVTYLLALNPDIQDKVFAEIEEIFNASNGEVTYDAVQGMKYLDNVISETLRLYSPVAKLDRQADEDYKLGDTGITITKNMPVSIPICALHKDSKYFPDPEKFDPDRFTPEERAKRDPFTYMPFGLGPRNCVALRFALMEMKVCLAMLVSQFRIKRCPETKVPLEFFPGIQLLRDESIMVGMEPRKDNIDMLQS